MKGRRSLSRKRKGLLLSVTAYPGTAAHVKKLKSMLRQAHEICGSRLQELNVALVDDRQMSALHRRFMRISGPTDVLSFPLEYGPGKHVVSGEIAICVPYARRQARKHGTTVGKEVLLYAVHGLLHLSGWDDRTAAQYQRMHRMEDVILHRLGVGPVFSPRPLKGRR